VHGLQRLHSAAELSVRHFLKEHQTETIASAAILFCYYEAVELWLKTLLLCSEFQSMGQTKL
jgi:hypothetical protein